MWSRSDSGLRSFLRSVCHIDRKQHNQFLKDMNYKAIGVAGHGSRANICLRMWCVGAIYMRIRCVCVCVSYTYACRARTHTHAHIHTRACVFAYGYAFLSVAVCVWMNTLAGMFVHFSAMHLRVVADL